MSFSTQRSSQRELTRKRPFTQHWQYSQRSQFSSSFSSSSAFTLVELIIVITILAILALVAFLMMSDATVSARDSNRLASIKNIYDASQLQAVQQRVLPLPDQAITLTVSGTDIGWQGYMSGYVAQAYGYSDSVYDPRDNTPYIYRVNQARNKSQYLAYLENGGEVSQGSILLAFGGFTGLGIDTAQATDFSKRVPYVYGDRLGVVLSNTTNEGAHALLGSGGTLDLGGNTIDSNYSIYVNESLKLSSIEGTGATALKTGNVLDDLIAGATIVASNGSSGSSSTPCGLTQSEVDELNAFNSPFDVSEEVFNSYQHDAAWWCATPSIQYRSWPSVYQFPHALTKLTNLQSIDASFFDNLVKLPSWFGELNHLTNLDLSNIPSLGSLSALYEVGTPLDNTENDITTLGQSVQIIASNNPTIQILVSAPPAPLPDCGLTNQEVDDLNAVQGDTYAAEDWCAMTSIDWRNLSLETLPNALVKLQYLETIDLTDNLLTGLPVGFSALTNLSSLNLYQNNFTSVPNELASMTGLTNLDFSYNQISVIPEFIGNLTNLTGLSFWHNTDISTLPDSLENLTHLTYLDFDENTLLGGLGIYWSIPGEQYGENSQSNITPLGQDVYISASVDYPTIRISVGAPLPPPPFIPPTCGLTQQEVADLNAIQTDGGPSGEADRPALTGQQWCDLTDLQFWGKGLTSIPESLQKIPGILYIMLADNNFTTLPDWIDTFSGALTLDVSSNSLISLPDEIGNMTNLNFIAAQYNNIGSLPNTIGNLTNLETFRIYDNNIGSLPNTIGNFTALTEFDLTNNQLSGLPESISNLTSLTKLRLSGNALDKLPDSLGSLDNQLRVLDLSDNPSLGNLNEYIDTINGWGAGTHTQTNITPLGAGITITSPNGNNRISITVTP